MQQDIYTYRESGRVIDSSKVLKNTYAMLALTLLVSAGAAAASIALNLSYVVGLVCNLAAIGVLWLVMPRTLNSSAGIGVVFLFTTLMGIGLGPVLGHYLAMPNGSGVVMQALGTTAIVFFGLSGYVLTTGKNFSFLGGFLMAGLIVAIVSMLGLFVAGMFGVHISGMMLAINAVVALLMCGFILYDTSAIVNGGETNYLRATVRLYLDILNLFTSLLHIFGALGDD
jgi:modulator of FtsH protease